MPVIFQQSDIDAMQLPADLRAKLVSDLEENADKKRADGSYVFASQEDFNETMRLVFPPAKPNAADQRSETIANIMATASDGVKRTDRLTVCSQCSLCERDGEGAKPWSKCRANGRRQLREFLDNPLAACPAGGWHAQFPLLDWAPATEDAGIIIGADDNGAWLVPLFVGFLRKHTQSTLPIYCADFGLSNTPKLPVDRIIKVPGRGLHPMYRKAATAMVAGLKWGVWYDTDILVRVEPELALEELKQSGHDLALRRGEKWWQIKHRADNWHTGVYAFKHGSETLRQWASWSLMGDALWVTAQDEHGTRDEEVFAELIRTHKLPVHDLSARHARLPSEFRAAEFGMPPIECAADNWHFPGTPAKQTFKSLAEAALAARPVPQAKGCGCSRNGGKLSRHG